MYMLPYELDNKNNATEPCQIQKELGIKIGSWACFKCKYCYHIDATEHVVTCTYPNIVVDDVEDADKAVDTFDLKVECRKIANLLDVDCPDSDAYIDGHISLFELVKRHVTK